MNVATRLRLGAFVLVGAQLLTTLAAMGLLLRMAPAVERILQENVVSLEAVERMLHDLGTGDGAGFADALARARANVTEPEETGIIARIEAAAPAAFAGDRASAGVVRGALLELGDVNRRSMVRADERARRLGSAGAWAMVLLGVAGFAASQAVSGQFRRRIEEPLAEIEAVVEAAAQGDRHRRARPLAGAGELATLARNLNELLDRQAARSPTALPDTGPLLAAVRHLLGGPGPAVLLSPKGDLLVANAAAEALLLGPEGAAWRRRLGEADPALPREALAGGTVICRLAPQLSEA